MTDGHDEGPDETTNLDIYGSQALPWSRPLDLLKGELTRPEVPVFLGTTDPDGRPHSNGIGVAWQDGSLYFTSGPGTRKARNLRANSACTLSLRLTGIDLVLDGDATIVDDAATLEKVAEAATVVRLPIRVPLGGRCRHRRAVRGDPVALLRSGPADSLTVVA